VRVISKIHCKWGEWSLVEAVLLALREFQNMAVTPDFVHLMSAADFPIRPIADMRKFLQRYPDQDYIESYDITKKPWVKGGLSLERFEFFFPANYQTNRKTFNLFVYLQRKIKMKRKIPLSLTPRMGSQWWTLRWGTCEKILDFIKQHPKVVRYFRSTFIPDESFFPTLVGHLIPYGEISNTQLLFHHFTPIGRPFIIYTDHIPIVRKLPHFFIRKVTSSARNSLWDAVKNRNSPIPRPIYLVRAHALVANAIDNNHHFSNATIGHID
jgi:Core-2/I-Branching enzyme